MNDNVVVFFHADSGSSSDTNQPRKGRLSARMLIPGNTWQTVWTTSNPVPARRQRRLFDDTREGEKVLHFLETRNIGQIVQLSIAPLYHASICRIKVRIYIHKLKHNL